MDITNISRQNSLPMPQGDPRQAPDQQTAKGGNGSDSASTAKGYESPVVKIDAQTGAAVLSFVDPDTGKQSFQVPSRTALEYERQQRLAEQAGNLAGKSTTSPGSSSS